MTTATIELDEDQDDMEPRQVRRIIVVTLAVLLPEELSDADVGDILPTGLRVAGFTDTELDDFIQVTVQDARLVMT